MGGFLLLPFAGWRARLRARFQGRAVLVLAALMIVVLASCTRMPGTVKQESLDLSARLAPYYQTDPIYDAKPERRTERLETLALHVVTTKDGYLTKPFKHGAQVVSCRLDYYTGADASLDAATKAALLERSRAFRLSVGVPAVCPEVGR